ncbi:MAG: hypothetical protein GY953_41205 [bacterium]|nr:hypothetical protein [bacterium]
MYTDAGNMPAAIESLDQVEERIRAGAPGFDRLPVSRVRFLRGHLQFRGRLLAEATETLHSILDQADAVEPETRALAGLRLGQTYDLLERRPEARNAYEVAIMAQPVSEAARLSRRYLLSPYREDKAVQKTSGDAVAENP